MDSITYVPTLDAYLLPGRLHPITVQLKRNSCSTCGIRPKNWCSHMRSAALKAGIQTPSTPSYVRSLSQLRKSQRPDKTKSGRKVPRRFDLMPIHELNGPEETEDIQIELASRLPPSTVDDIIEQVVQQAYENDEDIVK